MRAVFGLFRLFYLVCKYQILEMWINSHGGVILKAFYIPLAFLFCPFRFFGRSKNFSTGQKLLEFCQALGPIYVKFGQTLSTRPDIIGAQISLELQNLQDNLPKIDFIVIKPLIEQELNNSLEKVFDYIDPLPVACASVAQVHKARLFSGQEVALKVLKPGIQEQYKQSLDFLKFIARIAPILFKNLKRFKLVQVIAVFEASMHQELNLKLEAANCSELEDYLDKDSKILLPKIYWGLTTKNIMVTGWIDGVSIYDSLEIDALQLDRKILACALANMFFTQTYRDGFFHADLHPGNIFVTKNNKIALLDFGIMGRLATKDRFGVAQILYALLKRDYLRAAQAHLKAGYIPVNTDLALFAQHCRAVCEPIAGLALKDVCIGDILGQMFQVIRAFDLEIQPQLIMLQKSMMIIEGIGKTLDPDINMWQLAYNWMEEWARKNLTFEARIISKIKQFIATEIDI